MRIKCIVCKNWFDQTYNQRICPNHDNKQNNRFKVKKRYDENKNDFEWMFFRGIQVRRMQPKAIVNSWIF